MVYDIGEELPRPKSIANQLPRQALQRRSALQGRAERIPLYRGLVRLARDPFAQFEAISRDHDGAVVQLDLGLFRPYLVTRPEHVEHVLRDNAANYLREGMLWSPVSRLIGKGIAGEGPAWQAHRHMLQPLFSGKHVGSLMAAMAEAIGAAVDDLDPHARSGQPFDAGVAMTRIVQRSLICAFFGGRISAADADRLGPAIATAFTSLGARMVLPFVPHAIALPGDRAFRRAVRTVDEVMYPLVQQRRQVAQRQPATDDDDLVTMLCRARDPAGNMLDDRAVRDDIVAIFVAATETTAMALTWLWVALARNPGVAAKLSDEIASVVGAGPPKAEHVNDLRYLKMVLQESLRLYPVAWFVPRSVKESDVVGGVRIDAGATIILSPYLTQRLAGVWDRPHDFDPERFGTGRGERRHRFAYFPFGAGPHQCLGSHLFMVEAALIVATMLRRYQVEVPGAEAATQQAAVTLRPRRRVDMRLQPAVYP